MMMRVPTPICGGTITRNPLSTMAGLYDDDAVWPFTTGSVSVISTVIFCGISSAMATSCYVLTDTFIPSCK